MAVGSSTGAPRVTLCSVSDRQGLQSLCILTLPMPRAVSAGAVDASPHAGSSSSKQARLQGLVLLPTAGKDAGSSTALVALLACSDKPTQGSVAAAAGLFGAFGSGTGQQSADLYLVKVAAAGEDPVQETAADSTARQEVVAPADGSAAVVAALQALQQSLEGRLDAMQATLSRMEQRLEALEQR